ncbi:uncharacterized protein LOC122820275 [Gambusia affinis]|uniref:uncharacterized protein LOC122820275 n=1 Tax=Gambusia affinis TaxID=33528 RepID=UPI001CDD15AE|nr:uncharacterized protein LOC122820275 [Gambusia affinis]
MNCFSCAAAPGLRFLPAPDQVSAGRCTPGWSRSSWEVGAQRVCWGVQPGLKIRFYQQMALSAGGNQSEKPGGSRSLQPQELGPRSMSSGCPRRRAAAAGAPLLGKLPGKVRLCGPQPVNLTSGEGKKSEQLRAEIQSEATATERGSERLIAPPAGGGRRSWKVEERRERKGAFMQPPPRCTGSGVQSRTLVNVVLDRMCPLHDDVTGLKHSSTCLRPGNTGDQRGPLQINGHHHDNGDGKSSRMLVMATVAGGQSNRPVRPRTGSAQDPTKRFHERQRATAAADPYGNIHTQSLMFPPQPTSSQNQPAASYWFLTGGNWPTSGRKSNDLNFWCRKSFRSEKFSLMLNMMLNLLLEMETSSNMLEPLLNTDSSGRSLDVRRWREESGVLLGRIWFLWQLMSHSGSGVMHVAHEVREPQLSRRMRRVRR